MSEETSVIIELSPQHLSSFSTIKIPDSLSLRDCFLWQRAPYRQCGQLYFQTELKKISCNLDFEIRLCLTSPLTLVLSPRGVQNKFGHSSLRKLSKCSRELLPALLLLSF